MSPADADSPQAGAGAAPAGGDPRVADVDFTTFVLSLSQAALQQLGCSGCDEQGKPSQPKLQLAQQTIDVLAMLQAKTRGNLTPVEEKLLGSILYDLRMRFVECARPPCK